VTTAPSLDALLRAWHCLPAAAQAALVAHAEGLVADARRPAASYPPPGQCVSEGCQTRATRGLYGPALCDWHGPELPEWPL
jgi:hypothetical protein